MNTEEHKELYRRTVLTDLVRDRGMPAGDHPFLHDPDLTASEWEGTAEQKAALEPKLVRLAQHLGYFEAATEETPRRRR